jgi:hypothetical protein
MSKHSKISLVVVQAKDLLTTELEQKERLLLKKKIGIKVQKPMLQENWKIKKMQIQTGLTLTLKKQERNSSVMLWRMSKP